MCGIAGIIAFEQTPELTGAALARMVAAIRHRGPDGTGQWHTRTMAGPVVAFGHARLAIIDLSEAGRQPMTRRDLVVTYNGEIYNYRDLRAELAGAGAALSTGSDTEVLLAGYERWGPAVVEHLHGMFAFGLWDGARERVVLARDRFGIKPLYFHQGERHVVFASEVRALLASGLVPGRLDPARLWDYLGYQTTATPSTLLAGVQMLEPGHLLEFDLRGGATSRRYWDLLAASTAPAPHSVVEARRAIGTLLEDAVTSHLVSDVPVGVFLSGGIDSGAIVSTLSSAGVRPQTFTVSFGERDLDESVAAARMAAAFGTEHHEIPLREDDLIGLLPEFLAGTDHPSGDAVNTFVVSRAVRQQGLKVALSGLGGDEIFGGYASFRRLSRLTATAERVGRTPAAVRRVAAGLVRTAGGGSVTADKAAAVLESDGTLAHTWPVTRQLFSPRARRRMLAAACQPPAGAAEPYVNALEAAFAAHPDAGFWARVSYAESRAYMHDVLLRDTDQMSMAHALEVRVPLLDHRLAAYVVGLPDAWKAGGATPKALLVDSLRQPLPDGIATQPKRGFTLPLDRWMRGALRPYCERQLGEEGLDGRQLLVPGEGSRLWRRFLDRAPGVTWGRVWSLVALNAWIERHSL